MSQTTVLDLLKEVVTDTSTLHVTVDNSITTSNASTGATGTTVPTQATYIGGTDGTNLRAVHVSAGGLVSVDGSGVTQPVSGTLGSKEQPDATSTYAPTNATTNAYSASLIVKAGSGVLYSITGYNSKTSAQFIQLHNTTTLPADTAVPVVIFTVAPSSNFSFSCDKFGRYFSTGITVCNSSTGPTKTIGSADCWFDVQYQ